LLWLALANLQLTSLIQAWTISTVTNCTPSTMWPRSVWWFWRSFYWTWLLMCPNIRTIALRNERTIWWQTKTNVFKIIKSLLYFMRFVNWNVVHENKPLFIKARNDLGLIKENSKNCIVQPTVATIDKFLLEYSHHSK